MEAIASLTRVGVSGRWYYIQRLTKRRFGPHRFRHAIAISAVLRDPSHPGLASGVLAISNQTTQKSYTLAGQSQAMMSYDQLFERRRKATAAARQTDQVGERVMRRVFAASS